MTAQRMRRGILTSLVLTVLLLAGAAAPVGAQVAQTQDATPGPEATPMLTVTPNADLVDHQVVTVRGTGFRGHRFVDLFQCEAGSQDLGGCVIPGFGFSTLSGTGTFDVSGGLDAVIRPFGGPAVDCRTAPGACEIVAFGQDDAIASVPLSFDPSAPLADPPTLTVTPSTGLVDGQVVQVDAAGFRPGSVLFLFVCESDVPSARRCPNSYGASDDTRVDDAGTMSAPYRVRTIIEVEGHARVDCRVARCFLSASPAPWEEDLPLVALEFDRDAPLLPDPTLTVTPSTGIVDGQTVRVTGSNWFAGEEVWVQQCRAGDRWDGCARVPFPAALVESDGSFQVAIGALRTFQDESDREVNCLDVACVVRAEWITNSPNGAVVEAPLTFAADATVTPATPTAVEPRFTG